MHPRNPYRNPPDFSSLANSYPKLKPYLIVDPTSRRTIIDFQNEQAQRRLTEAIMFRDFDVSLHIPLTRLCPPVPNRMNYALWIQDIVHAHEQALGPPSHPIRGIDIGTGATAIYPFLICKLQPTWEMIATELDEGSFESAVNNVAENAMDCRIHVMKATANGTILFPLEGQPHERFEFTMCNPPFYASPDEVFQSAQDKAKPPNAVCTGADVEMIYPNGGEEGFVGQMVEESARFQTRCKWYTSMLGKMSSVSTIVEKIRQLSITNYAVTEFVQGQTRRWAIAWSFTDCRLPDAISRISHIGPSHGLYACMPPRTTLVQPFQGHTVQRVSSALSAVLGAMHEVTSTPAPRRGRRGGESEGQGQGSGAAGFGFGETSSARSGSDRREREREQEGLMIFVVEAQGDTWSRSARRGRKRAQVQGAVPGPSASSSGSVPDCVSESGSGDTSKPALTCSCRVAWESDGSLPSSLGGDGDARGAGAGATEGDGHGGRAGGGVGDGDPQISVVVVVEFQWMFGADRSLFESFVGHVGRKVGSALRAQAQAGES